MSAERVGMGAWIVLVALQFAWYLWLAPPAGGNALVALALTIPPLLLPLFALRTSARRALLWLGVVALFYFCHGVVAAWVAPDARVPALIESALCVVVIGAIGWDARRGRKRGSAELPSP
ncbi:MAG: DUF2069 domain-containing protein, partial [Rhodanobacteraceae bacterium]